MNKLKVAVVQERDYGAVAKNWQNSRFACLEAAQKGAELVVLHELHGRAYFCQDKNNAHFAYAEPLKGPTFEFFSQLARELKLVMVCSIFEKCPAGDFYNTALVIEKSGALAGFYRKMHIPNDPAYWEGYYFKPSANGFEPIQTSVGKLGVMICFDQWIPEAARIMALKGAELLIYPTSIGYEPADSRQEQQRQKEAWMTVQRGHAVANLLPVVAVNRVGLERGENSSIEFWGNSFAAGPQGELLARAGDQQSELLIAEIDLQRGRQLAPIWTYARDRRKEFFSPLLE